MQPGATEQPHAGAHGFAHGRGEFLQRRRAFEQVHRVEQRLTRGHLERVERAVGLEPLRDLDRLVDVQPATHAVVHVELGQDGDPVADGVTHGARDRARERVRGSRASRRTRRGAG